MTRARLLLADSQIAPATRQFKPFPSVPCLPNGSERAVVPGGVVCFHYIDVKEGVTKFFRQLVYSRLDYEHGGTMECLAILVKHPAAPALLPVE